MNIENGEQPILGLDAKFELDQEPKTCARGPVRMEGAISDKSYQNRKWRTANFRTACKF